MDRLNFNTPLAWTFYSPLRYLINTVALARCADLRYLINTVALARCADLRYLINTVALARCADALTTGELFQRFPRRGDTPLNRLTAHSVPSHRAKAAVLISGLGNVKYLGLIILLAGAHFLPAQSRAAEYFVSPAGNEGNKGTQASPWPSVNFALSRATGGDTITLLPGSYNESVVVDLSGTAAFPTVIRSQNKWDAILQGAPGHGVYVADGVTNVVIDGLQVAGAAIDGIKVGSFAAVRNCWIHNSTRQGISANATHNTLIEYNLVEQNGTSPIFDHGMYISGTNLVVRGNVIRRNRTYGCQIYADAPARLC